MPATRPVTGPSWLVTHRRRYKRNARAPFANVRDRLKTGDIILFHKTTRSGWLDVIELDVLSPLLFRSCEFRHSGIVVRDCDTLFVLECAAPAHSGHEFAVYPTGGRGIRMLPLDALLAAYDRDNGEPHYGVRLIPHEIPASHVHACVAAYGPVEYLDLSLSVPIIGSRFVLPRPVLRRVVAAFPNRMTCAEFVHDVLCRCGAMRGFPSKLIVPYAFEDPRAFRRLDAVGFSDILRFEYGVARL